MATTNAAAETNLKFSKDWENSKATLIPVGRAHGLLSADDCMSWGFEAHAYAVSHYKRVIGKSCAEVGFDAYYRTCFTSLLLRSNDPSTRFGNISLGANDDDAPEFDIAASQPDVGDDPDFEGWRTVNCETLVEKSRHFGSEIHALTRFFCDGGSVEEYAHLHGVTVRTVERIIADFNKKAFEKPGIAASFGQGSLFGDDAMAEGV